MFVKKFGSNRFKKSGAKILFLIDKSEKGNMRKTAIAPLIKQRSENRPKRLHRPALFSVPSQF